MSLKVTETEPQSPLRLWSPALLTSFNAACGSNPKVSLRISRPCVSQPTGLQTRQVLTETAGILAPWDISRIETTRNFGETAFPRKLAARIARRIFAPLGVIATTAIYALCVIRAVSAYQDSLTATPPIWTIYKEGRTTGFRGHWCQRGGTQNH